ncbi:MULTISPECIES: hypothetical protein [Vagococcus]|uniref:hypothetical protein n=1 Tax=Vagococcus TaxID=2737 RepID=UPI000B35E866|nr:MULTISPECIES: hypothetical protein [Vagococcus]HCM90503.1 hypothetical protein [Vagococcus sp.]
MKKKIFLLSILGITTFSGVSASAVSVTKKYRYDYNTYYNTTMNYHAYQYINIPNSSRYTGFSEYQVGGGWNYNRYEHVNYYSGGY